jgi:hypothetical protein
MPSIPPQLLVSGELMKLRKLASSRAFPLRHLREHDEREASA